MIYSSQKARKMLRNFLLLSLFFVATRASGELTLLNVPSSLTFKGEDALQSEFVGDVLYAALGNAVAGDVAWPGLTINNPFELPKRVVALFVDGVRHNIASETVKSYTLQGSDSEESLSVLSAQLQAENAHVCKFNLRNLKEAADTYAKLFGADATLPAANGQNVEQQVAFIESIAANWDKLQSDCEFFWIRASVEGSGVDAATEGNKAISAAYAKLSAAIKKTSNKNALVVAIASKAARSKRDVLKPNTEGKNPFNLAKYYSEDYPAIFNIIFWFMVVFFLALLAISYALAFMDPGKDSIIYRMTSTRMKKDN